MFNQDKFTIVSTMSPRLELDFVEEWISYHSLYVDEIIIFYDPRPILFDDFYSDDSKVAIKGGWSKKPHLNFHEDLSFEDIMGNFKSICKFFQKVRLYEGSSLGGVSVNQIVNLMHSIHMTDNEWIYHIDCDEFLKIDDKSIFKDKHVGISASLMNERTTENKESVQDVLKIILSKGPMLKKHSLNWKVCYNKQVLLQELKAGKSHAAHKMIHCWDYSDNLYLSKSNEIQLFHYCGWNHRRRNNVQIEWQKMDSILHTEMRDFADSFHFFERKNPKRIRRTYKIKI